MRILLLGLALLFFAGQACSADADHPASARVRAFLDAHGMQSGVPDEKQLATMRPFLGQRLAKSMASAKAYQRSYIRKYPGNKPPFSEGSLFNSVTFEGYEDFVVGEPVEVAGGALIVPVTYRIEKRYWPADPWMDQYVMSWEDGEWRLTDVIYLVDAAFGAKGRGSRLRQQLDHRYPGE
jgi:hypothetical protein